MRLGHDRAKRVAHDRFQETIRPASLLDDSPPTSSRTAGPGLFRGGWDADSARGGIALYGHYEIFPWRREHGTGGEDVWPFEFAIPDQLVELHNPFGIVAETSDRGLPVF